ncbi:MAG: ABC transporter permease [Actinobacteria bacterium]|nr:ABC transporter permease [Actinomycetota bacterium]
MEQFLGYIVLGIVAGSIYAVAASGLVLTYTTTGVFNFAHGAIGMLAGFIYWQLRVQQHVPTPLALVLVIFVFAPLFGTAVERILMRGLRGATVATTLVVTVGLTVGLIGGVQALWKPGEARFLEPLFGNRQVQLVGRTVTWDELAFIAVAIAVAISLRILLFRTRIGVAMRAVVDNPELTGLNGAKPTTVARTSWILGSMLASIAGVLVAPKLNLEPIVMTFLVVNAYAAAIVGKLRSLPLTFAGALALGVIENLAIGYLPEGSFVSRLRPSLPTLFFFAALLALPEARLRIGRVVGRSTPRIPNLNESLARGAGFLALALVISALAPSTSLPDMTQGLVFAIIMLSLVVLSGYSGQVSLSQLTFVGLGAWAMGSVLGGDSLLGLVAAAAIAIPVSVLVALPAMRLQGIYLALLTFAFAVLADYLIFNDSRVFGGGNVQVGRLQVFGVSFRSGTAFFMLTAFAFAALSVGVLALRRGSLGRTLAAMRDSPAACATLGLDVRRTKLIVFMISAAIAGVGGAFVGGLRGTVGTIDFTALNNLPLYLLAVVGGVTTVSGAFIGGALFALLPVVQSRAPDLAGLVFLGIGATAVSLGRQPNGLAGMIAQRAGDTRRPRGPAASPATEISEEVANVPATV